MCAKDRVVHLKAGPILLELPQHRGRLREARLGLRRCVQAVRIIGTGGTQLENRLASRRLAPQLNGGLILQVGSSLKRLG